MTPLETWEKVVLGISLALLIIWFLPRVKAALEDSRKVENPDWMGALVPIGLVLLFILLIIAML